MDPKAPHDLASPIKLHMPHGNAVLTDVGRHRHSTLPSSQVEQQASLRAEVLRVEQQRALDLLQRERAAVAAVSSSADERLRRAEQEMRALARAEEELRAKLDKAQEEVGSHGWCG